MESVPSLLPICFTGIFPSTLMRKVNKMLRDLLSSRWFQAGIAFFMLCVGGSLLYSWHVQRTTESNMARHGRFLEGEPEKQNATRPIKAVSVENANDTAEIIETLVTTELPSDSALLDAMDAFLPDDIVPEEAPAEDVAVSPYGFGPYPELPPEWEGAFPPVSVKHELMVRVAVKLREQGVNVEGPSMEDGYVFPTIKGIHYVKWKVNQEGIRYISERTGHPADGDRIYELQIEKGEPLTESDIPSDIQLVSYEEGRIDPMIF